MDIVFVGSGADELRFGRAQLTEQVKRDLAQAAGPAARVGDVHVSGSGHDSVAWFCARLHLDVAAGRESFTMPMRVTGIASRDTRWRFRQTHFSRPSQEQRVGDSFPACHEATAVHRLVRDWRSAIETGDLSTVARLSNEDALFDVNLPDGRFQLLGGGRIAHQLGLWHSRVPEVVEWKQQLTESGVIAELALWEGDAHELYTRAVHVFSVAVVPGRRMRGRRVTPSVTCRRRPRGARR